MTLDEELVRNVDRISKKLHTSRSAFTRDALRAHLARFSIAQQEKKHREGYKKYPVVAEEFAAWDTEQDWGEE